MITTKKFGVYTATHDSENADGPRAQYIPSNCWAETEEDGVHFHSSLDVAFETGKLVSEDDGDIDIPKATLMEIKAWADNLNRQ